MGLNGNAIRAIDILVGALGVTSIGLLWVVLSLKGEADKRRVSLAFALGAWLVAPLMVALVVVAAAQGAREANELVASTTPFNWLDVEDKLVSSLSRAAKTSQTALRFVGLPVLFGAIAVVAALRQQSDRGATRGRDLTVAATTALLVIAAVGTLVARSTGDPRTDARARVRPIVVAAVTSNIAIPASTSTCFELSAALALLGMVDLSRAVPRAADAAVACVDRRLAEVDALTLESLQTAGPFQRWKARPGKVYDARDLEQEKLAMLDDLGRTTLVFDDRERAKVRDAAKALRDAAP